MSEKTKRWWDATAKYFQDETDVPIKIHYGTGSASEDKLNLIKQDLKGKKVVEMGCGAAQGGIAFAKKGAEVTGIDISEEQLKQAREICEEENVELNLYQGEVTDLNMVETGSQDIVYSAYVFQWVEDLEKTFSEAYRVLKKNGVFIFSLPHPFSQYLGLEGFEMERNYHDTEGKTVEKMEDEGVEMVLYRHTIEEIFDTLKKVGFEIERIVEPDPREAEGGQGEQWVDEKIRGKIPNTIIFKAKKR